MTTFTPISTPVPRLTPAPSQRFGARSDELSAAWAMSEIMPADAGSRPGWPATRDRRGRPRAGLVGRIGHVHAHGRPRAGAARAPSNDLLAAPRRARAPGSGLGAPGGGQREGAAGYVWRRVRAGRVVGVHARSTVC